MGINVLTVSSAFASNACANSVPPRSQATQDSSQFGETPQNTHPSQASTDDLTPSNPAETITTDNKPLIAQNEPMSRPPQDSANDFRKTLTAQTSRSVQDNSELKKQSSGCLEPVKAAPTQPLPNQGLPVAVLGTKLDKLMGIELESQNRPASSIATPKPYKSLFNPAHTAKPSTPEPAQTTGGASLLQNKPLHSTLGQSQTKPETIVSDVSEATDNSASTDSKQSAAKNASQTPVTVAKVVAAQENGQALTPAVDSKTQAINQELMPKMFSGDSKTTTGVEEPAQTGQSAAPGTQKTAVFDGALAALNDKFTDMHQDGPGKTAFVVQKSASDDVNTAQQVQAPISEDAAKRAASQRGPKLHSDSGNTQTENTSGDSMLHKLNPAQIQVSTNQSKGRGSFTSKTNSSSDFQQTFSHSSTPNLAIDNSSASRQAVKGADNPLPSTANSGLGEQIRESMHSLASQGDQRITIRLNPPELGYVSIKLVEQADEITGLLEVSRTQTRYEIEQVLPEVLRNLADSGVQIKRLDVLLADQSEQQNYKDQSLQDGWSGQHNSTEGGSLENKTTNEYLDNDYSYPDSTEPHQMFITDNSVDMLV